MESRGGASDALDDADEMVPAFNADCDPHWKSGVRFGVRFDTLPS
jgi:hypothetical protein